MDSYIKVNITSNSKIFATASIEITDSKEKVDNYFKDNSFKYKVIVNKNNPVAIVGKIKIENYIENDSTKLQSVIKNLYEELSVLPAKRIFVVLDNSNLDLKKTILFKSLGLKEEERRMKILLTFPYTK